MNQINPEKLFNSKWTAVNPSNKELHFIVTKLHRDPPSNIIVSCTLEAVISKNCYEVPWQSLKNQQQWLFGWQ